MHLQQVTLGGRRRPPLAPLAPTTSLGAFATLALLLSLGRPVLSLRPLALGGSRLGHLEQLVAHLGRVRVGVRARVRVGVGLGLGLGLGLGWGWVRARVGLGLGLGLG